MKCKTNYSLIYEFSGRSVEKRERIEFTSAYNIDIKTITARTDNSDKKKNS